MRLLSPLDVGPVRLRNRIVSTAHQTTLVDDGVPTPDWVAYHGARVAGEVGLICIEACAVHPSGALSGHGITGWEQAVVAPLRELATLAERSGTRVFAQLFHGGRENWGGAPRAPLVAPSAVPSPRFKTEPRALTEPEIEAIIAGHELVAARCREAGLHGVEVCASHGYLPSQFLEARTNQRDDAWGQDRTAYVRAALAAARRGAGPELAVGIRLSAHEALPEGRQADASGALLRELAAEGLMDYASIVVGDSAEHVGAARIVPPPPVPADAMHEPATAVRVAGPGVPLIVATRVFDPDGAEALLQGGVADAVGMNRALIADPDLPRKLREGRDDERILCIGCNQGCIGRYHLGLPIRCLQNARTGRERVPEHRPPRGGGGNVLVIGAGPAGIAAAETAALAGARTTLVEAGATIGGQLALAGSAPGHAELAERFVRDRTRRLERAGVQLRLGERVPTDHPALTGADAIVVATGARPYTPTGLDVVAAWDVLAGAAVDGPVLVADWGGGWDGLSVAELLAARGVQTTLACAAVAVGDGIHQYQRTGYLERLERLGVGILHHRALVPGEDGPRLRSIWTHRTEALPPGTRTVVVAHGRVPEDGLLHALRERGLPVEAVGDCLGPRTAEEALLEGATAGERAAHSRAS